MNDQNSLTVYAEKAPLTAAEVRAQVNLIQEVMASVMKKDVHYGIIPGCDKPSLYQAGAEKIALTFHLAAEVAVIDLGDADEARFRVFVHINTSNGVLLGTGVGEASSDEEKYRWRGAVCEEEFNATPEDRRRIKFKKSQQSPYQAKQIRTNIADVRNTVLKMAQKRAYVAAVRSVTAASDVFAQDIEDLPEEIRAGVLENEQVEPEVTQPQRKSASMPPPAPTPSASPPDPLKITMPQGKRLYAIAKGIGWSDADIKAHLDREHGIRYSADIPRELYEGICAELAEGPAKHGFGK
jgi:hypothetical protein